jgi:hypothetical protein
MHWKGRVTTDGQRYRVYVTHGRHDRTDQSYIKPQWTSSTCNPVIWVPGPSLFSLVVYEGQSVNRSQMDTKRKICDIRTWKNIYFSTYPPLITLPVRRNPQHRSLLTVVSATSATGRASSVTFERPWENFSTSCVPLYVTNTSHHKHVTFLHEYPLHWVLLATKTHTRTLLFARKLLTHGYHFDYWNQPLSMRMHVCQLDCHEAGVCCYLVIIIENLLHQLQLFYFHLWHPNDLRGTVWKDVDRNHLAQDRVLCFAVNLTTLSVTHTITASNDSE